VYRRGFEAVQAALRLGNSYETNLTYRIVVESADDPLQAYRRLRRLSPAPYAAFITHGGTSLLSSSPERFATVTRDRVIETRPIKGTTARDPDPARDAAAARRLTAEPKFRGENLMIVDLLRNDMAQVCELGSVAVTDLMHVESYPAVHQLVTTIQGRLRPEVTTLAALRALFPGGSMTGAPKLRTMQIIAGVEATPRGPYSGAVGWILDDGSADLGIVIRSLVHRAGRYTLGTGGGITVGSSVEEEYAEASWKASRLLAALGVGLAPPATSG
jgi:anthranilate/para-aminobenzoate synthase component I